MFPFILLMLLVNVAALAEMLLLRSRGSRIAAIIASVVTIVLTLFVVLSMIGTSAPYTESYGAIAQIGLNLSFSVSGISALLTIMAEIVLLAAAIAGNPENQGMRLSSAMILLFQIAAIGLFNSANLLLFFIFWDIGVIALFIMINVLGSANRRQASFNFLLYELFASSLLLLAIIILFVYSPTHSLDISYLASISKSLPMNVQLSVFALLTIAFMTNMPIFPFHSWLADAHTEASTQGSMMLSGILTKFGGYGMLTLFIMMPIAGNYSIYLAALAIFSSIYGSLLMIRQTDLKRIIAYSTIVEMGIILLAISSYNSLGTSGAVYGMISHGLLISLAFLAAGMIKHIFGERSINRLSGIASGAKATSYALIIGFIAMIGFPLTSGFLADILIFLGAIQAFGLYALLPLISILVMGAMVYKIISKCLLSNSEISRPTLQIGSSQKFSYALLSIAIIILGVIPIVILNVVKL